MCLVVNHFSGPETERLRKNVVKIFKDCGLSIRSKTNLKIVDYLDVTFDLQNNSYKPYRRPDNLPVYIHKYSNHPSAIINELPKSIPKRIPDLSSRENLRKSGFTSNLVYTPEETDYSNNNEENKRRTRKIIWFNPPFSKSVESNIVKTFLNLIKIYFPKTNKLNKILHKNTLKVSYSCMNKMSSILSSHNLNVINPYKTQTYGYNYIIEESCPLQKQRLTPRIICRADVKNDINSEIIFYF